MLQFFTIKRLAAICIIFTGIALSSCGFISNMTRLADCDFEFESISNMSIGDVDVEGKNSLSEFSFTDYGKMIAGYTSGKMQLNFDANIKVTNPNAKDIKLHYLAWQLFIDDKENEVVEGEMTGDYLIEGKGGSEVIAIPIQFNLMKIFNRESQKSLINFAMNLMGAGSEASRIGIKVRPSFKIAGKTIKYPTYIPVSMKYGGE